MLTHAPNSFCFVLGLTRQRTGPEIKYKCVECLKTVHTEVNFGNVAYSRLDESTLIAAAHNHNADFHPGPIPEEHMQVCVACYKIGLESEMTLEHGLSIHKTCKQ